MYWPGHVGVSLLLYAPVAYLLARRGQTRRLWAGAAALVVFTMAPDADMYVAALGHRGPTHTVWAALSCGGLLATAAVAVGASDAARFGFGVGAASVGSHLVGDVITPMGVRPFAPVHPDAYSLGLVGAGDPNANAAMLVCGTTAFWLALGQAHLHGALPTVERSAEGLEAGRAADRPAADAARPAEEGGGDSSLR